jgi:hypothetical protein
MTVSTGAFLQQQYGLVQAAGDKSISSDAAFVIDGFEYLRLLCKQFPWPILSPGGEIAIAGPNGMEMWEPQQIRVNLQGQVTFYETVRGDIDAFSRAILASGAKFNATVYEGSFEKYSRAVRIQKAFLQLDPSDRDWENRSMATMISGTLFYHYFGETIPGN